MRHLVLLLVFAIACTRFTADAKVVTRTFVIANATINQLCKDMVVTAVNGVVPGPTIEVTEGDWLVVRLINKSPYDMTIHWHGVHQRLTPWYDGPEMVTQCPIPPGSSFTQKFNVKGQEGTLWWHAHVNVLRATVFGALVIRPKRGIYPFPKPDQEVLIQIGEWWNKDIKAVEEKVYQYGLVRYAVSDAFTLNGHPGDQYSSCSYPKGTFTIDVVPGKTYMLRIINAAVNANHYFRVAGHNLTVVAVDAQYTNPYETDLLAVTSGQSVDVLLVANAAPAKYYMVAKYYNPGTFNAYKSDTTGIVNYVGADQSSSPIMPTMPDFNDTAYAFQFFGNLTGLLRPGHETVPQKVDEQMFMTVNIGYQPCQPDQKFCEQVPGAAAASLNNVLFELPTSMSLLEAYYKKVNGVYTTDFPDTSPVVFDYTNLEVNDDPSLEYLKYPVKGTRLKQLKYNTTVEIVFQNTALLWFEYHPMHLHGYDFFVVGQGYGNYNASTAKYNLKNPPLRNTVAVPDGGWTAVRFVANNPGVWLMHCHFDVHVPIGMLMAFEVENGKTWDSIVPPPPLNLPRCHSSAELAEKELIDEEKGPSIAY